VKPSEGVTGVYYLNSEVDGLKHADKNGSKRPLLGARKAVREWLKFHPTKDPDDYLITCLPSSARGEPGDFLGQTTIRYILRKIADEAGVDKPPNPHNFRHAFVTMAKRDYDMDNDTIKYLIGHKADSQVMETTYSHLTADDHIEKAEIASGEREPTDSSPLTPPTCDVCDETLKPGAKACPDCGTVYTPDARDAQREVQQDIGAARALSDGEISDEELKAIANDDALLAKLIEMRSGKSG
jgi:hypothetical protein